MPINRESTAEELLASWDNTLAHLRQLPSGKWIALHPFLFTVGLLVGVERVTYERRFCYPYERVAEAVYAVKNWDGNGDPPGRWIKEKGLGIDRSNPRFLGDIPVVVETSTGVSK